jgi:hypothetical protein
MNKLLFTILTGLFLGTNAFALSDITFTPATVNQTDYTNEVTFDVNPVIDINEILFMYYPDGSMAYSCENTLACINSNVIISNFFGSFQIGNIIGVVANINDPNTSNDCDSTSLSSCLGSSGFISNIGSVFSMTGSTQQVATVFAFVDRSVSNNTGNGVSTVLVPAVSNLWPIMLIVLGILITFYVLEKIIEMFKKNTKEHKKHIDEVYGKGDKTTYDSHGNIKSIEFGTEKPFFSKRIINKNEKEVEPLNWIAPEYPKKHKEKGGTIF